MINESKQMSIKLLRRAGELEKIGDIIEYQTEIQDPCDFEDEDDYEYPSEEMVEVRDEVEEYLNKKFYDYLVELYNDSDCE